MKTLLTSILVVMLATLVAGPASADIMVDITFDTGALPTDFGFSVIGGPMSIAGGIWDQDRAAGTSGRWRNRDDSVGGPVIATITGPVIHGYSELQAVAFSTNADDQVAMLMMSVTTDPYYCWENYMDGKIRIWGAPVGFVDIPVANTDGAFHKYGWELDTTSRMLKVFFDDAQVGDPDGYSVAFATADENVVYFGDQPAGEAHHSYWTRVVMAEGLYPGTHIPEPSSIVLLGFGVVGLLCYAWRKRR